MPKSDSNMPQDPKVFDVSKPGKTAPSDSSKPIIVTHRPMVKDPMVSAEKPSGDPGMPANDDEPEAKVPLSRTGTTIKPPPEASTTKIEVKTGAKPEKAQEKPAEKPPDSSSEVSTEEETSPQPAETAAPAESSESETPAETPETPAENGQEKTKSKEGEAVGGDLPQKSPEEIARQQETQALIDQRTYNVPIGEARKSKTLRHIMVAILILILLGAIGFELAIDAELIETDIPPAFDLIKN